MTMKTETKLIATEKMSVKEIRENGNTAQKYAVGIFDADYNGILEGNEVKLFNNCQFSYDEKSGQLRIYDNQIKKNGQGGQIVITPFPHEYIKNNNDVFGPEYYSCDIVKGDMISYGRCKYGQDFWGNKHFHVYSSDRGPCTMSSFDKIEVTPDYQSGKHKVTTKGITQSHIYKLGKKIEKGMKVIENGLDKAMDRFFKYSRENQIQQMKDDNNPNLGGFRSY